MDNKPLPKSLHTVSVLVRVARLHQRHSKFAGADWCMDQALETLGYSRDCDPHRLVPLAMKQLDIS